MDIAGIKAPTALHNTGGSLDKNLCLEAFEPPKIYCPVDKTCVWRVSSFTLSRKLRSENKFQNLEAKKSALL